MKKNLSGYFVLLVTILFACDEIIERDISKESISIIAPGEGIEVDSGRVTFFWDHLDDALGYSFQIVTGSFDTPDLLILDTITTSNKFTHELDSGTYSWGVSAYNGNYQTAYSTRSITISSNRQADGEIRLIFPTDQQTLTDTAFQFSWSTTANIEEYVFKILDLPEESSVTSNPFVLKTFDRVNATHQWKVIGLIKDSNQTIESPTFNFSINPN